MMVSLTEVQFMTRRACIGAGLPYGLADEAAYATRWLCGRGLPALENLLWFLKNGEPGMLSRAAPVIEGALWRWSGSVAAPLSPLEIGPPLAELPLIADYDRPALIKIESVLAPLLLLPWASMLATRSSLEVSVTVAQPDEAMVYLLRSDGAVYGSADPQTITKPVTVHVEFGGESAPHGNPLDGKIALADGAPTPDKLWEALNEYAHRGYVAATEESRLLGAGAGLIDND